MSALIDMALDDIIKSNQKYSEKNKTRRGGRGGAVGAFRRIRNNPSQSIPYRNKRQRAPRTDSSSFDENAVWEHDMFQEEEEEEEEEPQQTGRVRAIETGTKVSISNLEYSVSEESLKELFESVGSVKKVIIKYDKSGRSEGTAEVTFVRKADAQSAITKYNGTIVDGKKISLTILGSNLPVNTRRNNPRREGRGGKREPRISVSLPRGPNRLRIGGNRGGFRRGGRRGGNNRMEVE